MRDPFENNGDPTDEELAALVKSAFSPEKLGLKDLAEKQRESLEQARQEAREIIGDTHLERLRQAVRGTLNEPK